jgi:hypothetical protein
MYDKHAERLMQSMRSVGTNLTDTSSLEGAGAKTSTLEGGCEPWAFTQSGPMRTGEFISTGARARRGS